MAGLKKPKIDENELSQTINLKEIFGIDFKNNRALKEAVSQAFIDRIVERTVEGLDVTGKKFSNSKYSDEYADTLRFKAAGKSKGNVNLTQTGDMLRSIDVIEDNGANLVTIGIDDPDEAPKAHGHQTGKNGQAPKMKRPFFGLTDNDVDIIKSKFSSEIEAVKKSRGEKKDDAIKSLVLKLIDQSKELDNELTKGRSKIG